jgi:hypothetical protein
MQSDMHYYGTYVMARSAGIKAEAAKIIAYSAQFVDDNAKSEEILFKDAGSINAKATAHHAVDVKNLDETDQRQIWVPFHFLPGNEGESFTERLICRKNSKIAQEMCHNALSNGDKDYILQLIGITAHVFADTFAHYGFSGISSRRNKVINDSIDLIELDTEMEKYITEKQKKFKEEHKGGIFKNIKSSLIEVVSGALGHGAVATYPDRPYLKWAFKYEEPEKESDLRDNPRTFLEGCEELYNFFKDFVTNNPQYSDGIDIDFTAVKSDVEKVLQTQADKAGRIQAWQTAVKEGKFYDSLGTDIPAYDKEDWLGSAKALDRASDSGKALTENVYKYYKAASYHRNYILRTLLPKHELVIA